MTHSKSLPDMTLETSYADEVGGYVCGVDEAGRGPWAGPVSAGAVILDPANLPAGIDDSKALTEKRREALAFQIRSSALAWGVGFATVEEIETLNILAATGLAMSRAIEALQLVPKAALVDGNYAFNLPCETRTLVKGDSLSLSIAAASILAKTARDQIMIDLALQYPQYGFERHKGYASPVHLAALAQHGPCPAHRRTWAPIKALLEQA